MQTCLRRRQNLQGDWYVHSAFNVVKFVEKDRALPSNTLASSQEEDWLRCRGSWREREFNRYYCLVHANKGYCGRKTERLVYGLGTVQRENSSIDRETVQNLLKTPIKTRRYLANNRLSALNSKIKKLTDLFRNVQGHRAFESWSGMCGTWGESVLPCYLPTVSIENNKAIRRI